MNDKSVCREILTTAVESVGGVDKLAKLLRRNQEEVQSWLDGAQSAPMSVYFEACLLLSQFKWLPLWRSGVNRESGAASRPAIEGMPSQRV